MIFPIFPLNGAVLFPNTNLPLNIFEERYIEMVDYALKNNRLIGMVQKKESGDLFNIGCLGKITNFTETAERRYEINLEGINRFTIKKINKNNLKFITVEGENLNYNSSFKKDTVVLFQKLLLNFKKYLSVKKINFNTLDFESLDVLSLAKIICVILPLDHVTKQMLLELNNSEDFCENLISVLEIEIINKEQVPKIN